MPLNQTLRDSFERSFTLYRDLIETLETTTSRGPVAEALDRSAGVVGGMLRSIADHSDTQSRLLVDLLEHEVSHQGQLIRYLYGLRLTLPESWKARYGLS